MRSTNRWLVAILALLSSPAPAAPEKAGPSDLGRIEGVARGQGADLEQRWNVAAWQCGPRLGIEWRTPDGQLSASEDVVLDAAVPGRLAAYRLRRTNVGQQVEGVVRDGVLELEIRSAAGTRQARVPATPGLLAGPMLVRHAYRNLEGLRAGRELRADYLLGERATVIALRLVAERTAGAAAATTVRVEAASAMLRPFVPTTRLRFSADGALLGVSGRLLPQLGTAQAARPVDGELRVRNVQLAGGCGRPPEAA